MKNLIKISLAIAVLAIFASSCTTSKKQKCDAYGNLSSLENTQIELSSNEVNVQELN